jgi:lipopolysaccharide export system protein LptC
MTRTKIFSILGLLLFAVLTGWLQNVFEVKKRVVSNVEERHDPDYFMRDFVLTTMDVNGVPANRISSNYMEHFPDDDTTELTRPSILIFRQSGPPWLIKSDRGAFTKDAELVLLSGNVSISRKSGPDNRPVQLFTDALKVHPKSEFAETDRKVTMISDSKRTVGIGMRAYIKQGQLQLLKDVKVYYE